VFEVFELGVAVEAVTGCAHGSGPQEPETVVEVQRPNADAGFGREGFNPAQSAALALHRRPFGRA
jgi:hypothetical protein